MGNPINPDRPLGGRQLCKDTLPQSTLQGGWNLGRKEIHRCCRVFFPQLLQHGFGRLRPSAGDGVFPIRQDPGRPLRILRCQLTERLSHEAVTLLSGGPGQDLFLNVIPIRQQHPARGHHAGAAALGRQMEAWNSRLFFPCGRGIVCLWWFWPGRDGRGGLRPAGHQHHG